jgi:hypothetical protein
VKLTFTQSGGFTGLIRGVTIDTRDLPEEEGRRLESLVRSSGLFDELPARKSAVRDAHQYELVIEDGTNTRTVEFDETTKPAGAVALVKELKARSKPQNVK